MVCPSCRAELEAQKRYEENKIAGVRAWIGSLFFFGLLLIAVNERSWWHVLIALTCFGIFFTSALERF
jgi:hypothetical protein